MAASDSDWEAFPSYYELMKGIQDFLVYLYSPFYVEKTKKLESTWRYCNFTLYDILFVIVLALIWTILRHFATEKVFKPIAHYYVLTSTNSQKMPESAWKFVYYLCAWSYTLYVVVLSGNYEFFQKPGSVWEGWSLNAGPPLDIYLMYMVQCSFYVHSLYATLFLDTWRKDSLVMMIHHVLTVLLISISYSLRFHNIGSLVLLFHDACDILLEFTKLNVYFKVQGNKLVKSHEMFANITFFCFTVAWYVSRLYCYPLRVLYSATVNVQQMQLVLPCSLLMNCLLWALQLLNIYWFLFIIQFLYRVATGQVNEIDDTREYDVEEKFKLSSKASTPETSSLNGCIKSNGSYDEVGVSNGTARKKED